MTTLTASKKTAPRKPSHVVVLAPTDFADDWSQRPTADVAVGLRRLCDRDIQIAKAEASKFVRQAYGTDDGVRDPVVANQAWDDAFMRWAMASATTNPNDFMIPYFQAAQDTIGWALTPDGVRKLWAEYHLHVRRTDANASGLDDIGVARLAASLKAGKLAALDIGLQTEVRRLLAWCAEHVPAAEDEDDDDIYVVQGA